MREGVAEFLAVCQLAATTRELYRHYLELFYGWITEQSIKYRRVKPLDLAEWLADHPGWSDSTRHSAIAAVRAFYAWRFGKLHPILSFNVQRHDPGPQPTPDAAKIAQLLGSIDTSRARGKKLVAMICLILDTGMRAAEVCRLELDRVELERGRLWVRTKGSKWQPKRFFDYTRSCLISWLIERERIARPDCKTVFCVIQGAARGAPIGRYTLKTIFRRLGESAGIGKFSPHQLRRAFATFATENGAPSRLVQAAGGWENLEMVERYTRAISLDAMEKYSPVDRLMGLPPKKSS